MLCCLIFGCVSTVFDSLVLIIREVIISNEKKILHNPAEAVSLSVHINEFLEWLDD